jgi:hypothetical protein
MALAAGYQAAHEFDDIAVLRERLPSVLRQAGPVLVALRVEPEYDRRNLAPGQRPPDQAGRLRSQLAG